MEKKNKTYKRNDPTWRETGWLVFTDDPAAADGTNSDRSGSIPSAQV